MCQKHYITESIRFHRYSTQWWDVQPEWSLICFNGTIYKRFFFFFPANDLTSETVWITLKPVSNSYEEKDTPKKFKKDNCDCMKKKKDRATTIMLSCIASRFSKGRQCGIRTLIWGHTKFPYNCITWEGQVCVKHLAPFRRNTKYNLNRWCRRSLEHARAEVWELH